MNFASISVEGGLLPPDILEIIASGGRELPGQKPADFGISRNRNLPDVMQRSFADARDYWNAFQARRYRSAESPTSLTRQYWMESFLELLEFPRPHFQRGAVDVDDKSLLISHRMYDSEFAPPINIVAWNQSLDERGQQGNHTPHAAVQSYLNGTEALWGLATNGGELRLMRDSARLSKPSYLEFNLQAMLEGNLYNEFATMYRLLHASRFPSKEDPPHQCWIESYYSQGVERGGRVRERLRDGVKLALEVLGTAFLHNKDNKTLTTATRQGRLEETDFYRQLLRLVYRLLFLMVTEERKLLSRKAGADLYSVYVRYYSIGRLRARSERYFANDQHTDLWESLKETFRLFRDDTALELELSPLNGELFSPEACEDLESATCTNEELLRAIKQLSTFDGGGMRRRVNYAHLDVEELGSVYESLLDYRPVFMGLDEETAPISFMLAAGTERKHTGSYYTPPELVRELIESALVPVLKERLSNAGPKAIDKERALLGLRVCDPACGSGHFLLAATRRIARELAQTRTGLDEPALPHYREAVRDVVRYCVYGVDKNPLAVDLCKVALWIESHAAGFPLGFLDHRIKCGDSLIGIRDLECLEAGVPEAAYAAVKGDVKEVASYYRKINRTERKGQLSFEFNGFEESSAGFAAEMAAVGMQDERNTSDVQAKQELYEELRAPYSYYGLRQEACNLWTYAFSAPLVEFEDLEKREVPTSNDVRRSLAGLQVNNQLKTKAINVSKNLTYFHWPIEFPEVFSMPQCGFDVVLANPPWERIKLQEKEFFSSRAPEVADAPNKAARQLLLDQLQTERPKLAAEFAKAMREADAASLFVRQSGRNPLTGKGDVNTYSVFAEASSTLLNATGRAGLIVPTGIAMDNTNKEFFASLVESERLVSLLDFENRQSVFPGIHRSLKFCLLTISGTDRPIAEAEFAFFLHDTKQIEEHERRIKLTAADLALFNPNTRNCPMFRTKRDLDIARKIYRRAGVLWNENLEGVHGNPWGVQLSTMFHMSNDSVLFRTRENLEQAGWTLQGNEYVKDGECHLPLYEAKLFWQFDHRYSTFARVIAEDRNKGKARSVELLEKEDVDFVTLPRYWVHEQYVRSKLDKTGLPLKKESLEELIRTPDTGHRTPDTGHRVEVLASIARSLLADKSPGLRTKGQ